MNVGVFPSTLPSWHTQPSFFQTTLPTILSRLQSSPGHASAWRQIFSSFPSIQTLQSVLTSLFAHLSADDNVDGSPHTRALIKREAQLLRELLGRFTKDNDVVDGFSAAALGRTWSVCHARIFVCWIAGAEKGKIDGEGEEDAVSRRICVDYSFVGLELLLNKVMDIWANPEHVKHSLLSGHQCE